MRLEGVNHLIAKLESYPPRTELDVRQSLRESGRDLKARSQAVAPYRPGDADDHPGHLRDKAFDSVTAGANGPELEVGYNGPPDYLYVQHEGGWLNFMGRYGPKRIENYTTPGTGSKFLETPWAQNKARYVRDLADDVRKGLR